MPPEGRTRALGLRSLRATAFLVVMAVVAAPLAAVWVAGLFDAGTSAQMRTSVADAASEASETLGRHLATPNSELDAIAARREVRVRVVRATGDEIADLDHDVRGSALFGTASPFFGAGGTPTLDAYERGMPPIGGRHEVLEARVQGSYLGCELPLGGKLLLCQAARRVDVSGESVVVVVQKTTPRSILALSDVRFPILKLTLFVLAMGVALSFWLGRRIVGPIERLREQVLARRGGARSGPIGGVAARHEVGDLARAFDELVEDLAGQSRAKEAFVADLAHELKSPVAAVRACAEAMGGSGPIDPERAARLARVLDESSAKLDEAVTRFLELARAEAGMPGEERCAVDVAALVRGVAGSLAADERYRGVRFDVVAAPASTVGVAGGLETAFRNVLDNAASFAGDGGTVHAEVRSDGGDVELRVTDDGPGIPEADLARVFDRFFTTRGDRRGTGLGLALARAIIEAHGGAIAAASPPGGGATFTIRLPAP